MITTLLTASFLALSPVPQDAEPTQKHVGFVTLQIRYEPGYGASDVAMFVNDEAFLGSVSPDLAPAAASASGYVTVGARQVAEEIVTIRVAGNDPSSVKAGMGALLERLQSISPSGRTSTLEEHQSAADAVADAREALEEATRVRQELLESLGVSDPESQLQAAMHAVQSTTLELDDIQFQLAEKLALRDYLATTLRRGPVDESAVRVLQQQVDQAEREVDEMTRRYKENHPQLNAARKVVADLRAQLDQQSAALGSQLDDDAFRGSLEHELFRVERDVAVEQNRREHLRARVDELAERVKRLSVESDRWRRAEGAYAMAHGVLQDARHRMAQAEKSRLQTLAHSWLTVLSGPSFGVR